MNYKEQAEKYFLVAPPEFWKLSESELRGYGCGPGKDGDKLVPDKIWGLNVKVCCIIHDIDWNNACTIRDIELANERFLINLIALINAESTFLLRWPRRGMALWYYNAVEDVGKKMFEHDPNHNHTPKL